MIDPSAFVIKPDPSVVAQYRVTFIAFMLTYFVPLAIAACVQCELLWHKQTMLSLISVLVAVVTYMLVGAPLLACTGLSSALVFVIHIVAPTVLSILAFVICKLIERMSNELYRIIRTLLHKSDN